MNDVPAPYGVSYSQRVRDEFVALVTRLRPLGTHSQVLAAAREIDRRLRIYPQFGQPLRDLSAQSTQLWVGVVSPLVVQYVLDEARRLVMVVLPFRMLNNSGH